MSDVKDILNQIGYTNLQDSGSEYRTRPLYRESDSPSVLSINKTTGEWFDFVERIGGKIEYLIRLTLDLGPSADVKTVLNNPEAVIRLTQQREKLYLPRKFDKVLLLKLEKKHDYWVNRGVSKHTLELFEGGLSYSGKMAFRYVFPIFNSQNDLVGFSGRYVGDPKFPAPKWKIIGAKNQWCYPAKQNIEIIKEKNSVILTESIGNMLSLWEAGIKNVLVTFGVTVSNDIIRFLLRLNIDRITVAFDNDEEKGLVGNIAAEDARLKLNKYFDSSQVKVYLPTKNDFGDMSIEEINLWKNSCPHNI